MQDNWLDFLAGEGAAMQGNTVHHFNGAALQDEAAATDWLTALTDYAVIEVSSADEGMSEGAAANSSPVESGARPAASGGFILPGAKIPATEFLQNQFCNDLDALKETADVSKGQINGYCNPKGRLLALFYLIRYLPPNTASGTARYRMLLPASVAESFEKRLSMFVMGADAKVTSQPSLQVLAVAGSKAVAPLDSLLGSGASVADLEPYEVITGEGVQVLRLPAERWLLLSDAQRVADDWKTLASALQLAGNHRWTLSCIAQGEPSVHAETVEKFIPQMLNLQSIDALSFSKGCFPGQEIVARMQYLGKLKRTMRRISFNSDSLPAIGSVISSAEDADAGTLVSVACNAAGGYEGLAVLKVGVDVTTLAVGGSAAGQASELTLPYPVELPGSEAKA